MNLPHIADDTVQAGIELDQFISLVASMNRLLLGLTSIELFKRGDVGFIEWVALSLLAQKGCSTIRELARVAGITRKQAEKISRVLSQAELISVNTATTDDLESEISTTPLGRSRLATLNSQFSPMLSAVLKNKERTLVAAQKQLKTLMHFSQVADVRKEKADDREPTRARQINRVADLIGARTYLEIGVSWGNSFFAVKVPAKVGVDPQFKFNVKQHEAPGVRFCEMTSDDFFEQHPVNMKFDVIFIDGLHVFDQALRDFCNSLKVSAPGTVWIIDDVIPSDEFSALPDPRMARKMRESAKGTRKGGWHGDVYKVVFAIHDLYPQFSFATSSVRGNGKTIVWQEPRKDVIPSFGSLEAIDKMDYAEFLRRQSVMNLQPEDEVFRMLAAWKTARDLDGRL